MLPLFSQPAQTVGVWQAVNHCTAIYEQPKKTFYSKQREKSEIRATLFEVENNLGPRPFESPISILLTPLTPLLPIIPFYTFLLPPT